MKTSFLIALLCVLSPVPLIAQSEGTVEGRVTAKADGSYLPDATIRVEGERSFQAVTEDDGRFTFQRIAPGSYTIVVSHAGFDELTLRFSLKPREVRNLTLELSLRRATESVDVRAPTLLSPTFSPSSTAIDAEAIENVPLSQRNGLTDMIAVSTPGMIRGHDDFVHVRGHEMALNTFLNGVSFWENPHSVLSSGLSPDIIQSANVMTGGFPAEYGNRFGGVVDIVTKSGFSLDNHGSVSLGAGTALRHNLAVEYGGHSDKVGYYIYAAGFESARFLSPNDPRSIHDTGRGSHSFLQLDFNAGDADTLKLALMGDGTNFQIPKTSFDETYRPDLDASERTRGQSAVFSWMHSFSPDTLLSTSLYQRWSRVSLLPSTDPQAAVASNERTLSTIGIKTDLTRILGRQTLKGGIDLVRLRPDEDLFYDGSGYVALAEQQGLPHADLAGPNGEPISFAARKAGAQGSVYVQDTIRLTGNLTADLGIRFDRYSLAMSQGHFSPRVNFAYLFPSSGTAVHASYDHFFVPPAVENVLISSAGLTRYLQELPVPLPPLQPVIEDQFEVGINHPFSRHLRVGVTGYYRSSDNPVHTVLFPDSRVYAYANFDRGEAYGMEVRTEVPLVERLGLSGYLNYALSRVYFWNPATAGFVDESHHLEEADRFLAPMDQTHTLNAGFTYRHERSGLWMRMTFEYGSGTPTEAEEEDADEALPAPELRVPGHLSEDLTIGADLWESDVSEVGLQFNIENLTDNVYKVSQESIFSPGEYFHPRFYSGSLKYRF